MHYPKTKGCKVNTTCIEIKEEYKVVLDDNVLEKYPVSLILQHFFIDLSNQKRYTSQKMFSHIKRTKFEI